MEIAVVAGLVLGVVGFIPQAKALEASRTKQVGAAAGIVATIVSFVIMSLSLAYLYVIQKDLLLTFGVTMVATYLLLWSYVAYKHYVLHK